MVPCAAMRFALAQPRRSEDQPGLPRRLRGVWGFLIEGPLLIGRFVRNPYANAQYDCGFPEKRYRRQSYGVLHYR